MTKREKQLEAELAQAKETIRLLELKIDSLIKIITNPKSEKLNADQLELLLNGEEMGKSESSVEENLAENEEPMEEEEAPKKAKKKRKKASPRLPEHLDVVIAAVVTPLEVQANPELYEKIGEEYQDLLSYTAANYFKSRTVNEKYILKNNKNKAPIQAPMPPAPIPGCLCDASVGAHLLVSKYCDHIPQYRLSSILNTRHNISLGRNILNRWCINTISHLEPICQAIHSNLMEQGYLQCDETPINYLEPGNGSTKQGYLWVINNPTGEVYYHWKASRAAEVLVALLFCFTSKKRFKGYLQCDGYSAYKSYSKKYLETLLVACMAHIRRKFIEAKEEAPRLSGWILKQIRHLYEIENRLRNNRAGPALREAVRSSESAPIVKRLKKVLDLKKDQFLPKSKISVALNYALKQWPEQIKWLEDGHIEIDNNLDENAVRPTKLGMKNWLFFGSKDAGKYGAIAYTLIENCKRYGLNPEVYLTEVIKALPANATVEQARHLTPQSIASHTRTKTA